jgi:hypothetical protein
MKIRYIKQDQIDRQRWDTELKQCLNANLCASSWYLDIVAGHWDALVEGDYQSFMPLPHRHKYGISYLYQPVFAQQLGVFSKSLPDSDLVRRYLEALPAHFKLADINLNKWLSLEPGPWTLNENSNYELELIAPYEQIAASYSENLKRSLSKARAGKWLVQEFADPREVIKLFRANRGAKIHSLREADYQALLRLIYQLAHHGMLTLSGVFDEKNQLMAAAVFAEEHHRSIFLFSGLSEYGRKNSSMHLIIDSYIRRHAGTARILDFEGSNDPGLARFYASFGSRQFKYQSVRLNRLPLLIRPIYSLYASRKG